MCYYHLAILFSISPHSPFLINRDDQKEYCLRSRLSCHRLCVSSGSLWRGKTKKKEAINGRKQQPPTQAQLPVLPETNRYVWNKLRLFLTFSLALSLFSPRLYLSRSWPWWQPPPPPPQPRQNQQYQWHSLLASFRDDPSQTWKSLPRQGKGPPASWPTCALFPFPISIPALPFPVHVLFWPRCAGSVCCWERARL